MDALLARLGVQAMNYAIRSGIALTSTYAISQCSRLLKTVDDKSIYSELKSLQKLLNAKIKVRRASQGTSPLIKPDLVQIISPAIDLIEFKYLPPSTSPVDLHGMLTHTGQAEATMPWNLPSPSPSRCARTLPRSAGGWRMPPR